MIPETRRLFRATDWEQIDHMMVSIIADQTYQPHHHTNECTEVFWTSIVISVPAYNHNSTDNGVNYALHKQLCDGNLAVDICAAGLERHRNQQYGADTNASADLIF